MNLDELEAEISELVAIDVPTIRVRRAVQMNDRLKEALAFYKSNPTEDSRARLNAMARRLLEEGFRLDPDQVLQMDEVEISAAAKKVKETTT